MERMKLKKVLVRMLICIMLIFIIGLLSCVMISTIVQKSGEKDIVSNSELPKKVDAIIVLGAGVNGDGTPSDILYDRLATSKDIYDAGIQGKLLLSGDHGQDDYNEVKAMKKYAIENIKINEEDIFLDHAGFSTYESIYRAKEIFKVETVIIVTNRYHLPRALYLAKQMGIKAYGVASDKRNYLNQEAYESRERVAQIKDFMYVNIIKPEPTYLGDDIPVNSTNGNVTDDELK